MTGRVSRHTDEVNLMAHYNAYEAPFGPVLYYYYTHRGFESIRI